jgi:hypothetical protein
LQHHGFLVFNGEGHCEGFIALRVCECVGPDASAGFTPLRVIPRPLTQSASLQHLRGYFTPFEPFLSMNSVSTVPPVMGSTLSSREAFFAWGRSPSSGSSRGSSRGGSGGGASQAPVATNGTAERGKFCYMSFDVATGTFFFSDEEQTEWLPMELRRAFA